MGDRDWLVFEDAVRDPAIREVFDRVVAAINSGTAVARPLNERNLVGFILDEHKVVGIAVLEYVLGLVPASDFDADAAREFSERMRVLLGWGEIDYTLHLWVEKRLRDPYFVNRGSEWNPNWERIEDVDASHVPEDFFRFACYIAICDLKFGMSFAHVYADAIFDWVTRLGSALPAQLKKQGTGDLPAEFISFAAEGVRVTANDALAVIRIRIAEESETAYAAALDYLVRLLETTDFPRSFAIEFRGPTKTYLPVKGLPKKGVHQLFASAAAYPALWPAIELYARAAMREYEWYTNVDDEDPAMPGTFAVFALGLASTEYAPLVLDYLREVDGEHQAMQAKFAAAYIDAHGFTPEAVAFVVVCAGNIQHLEPRKTYPGLIANKASLQALLDARSVGDATGSGISALRANLAGEPVEDYAWRAALHAVWGSAAEERDADGRVGAAVTDRAPAELRPLYEAIFDVAD